jgi:signal transduction histidine kinase
MISPLRGLSVRGKLLLLSGGPVLVTSAALIALIFVSHRAESRAGQQALAWQHHALALRNLDWAVRFYLDDVGDGTRQDPVPDRTESREALTRARAEALLLSLQFSDEEQLSERRLDERIGELVAEGERVGRDQGRLHTLEAWYRGVLKESIRRRVQEEDAGSDRAIRGASDLSRSLRRGGLLVGVLCVLVALAAAVLAVRGVGGRVTALDQAAARVAKGNLSGTVPVTSEDELGRLTRSLNRMVEALRHQRERQLEALAAVAHDLRNPLGVMRLTTEPILRGTELPPEPALRRAIALIHRQIERLTRLASDLVDAASIDAGELRLERRSCDLSVVARDVAELYAKSSRRHEVRLCVPAEPAMANCDPARIAQVLENLVNNAIKYSPEGGPIDVTVRPDAGDIVISVADQGSGIEPDKLETIFEPFCRIAPSKDAVPGIGLGLAICRRIVAAPPEISR